LAEHQQVIRQNAKPELTLEEQYKRFKEAAKKASPPMNGCSSGLSEKSRARQKVRRLRPLRSVRAINFSSAWMISDALPWKPAVAHPLGSASIFGGSRAAAGVSPCDGGGGGLLTMALKAL